MLQRHQPMARGSGFQSRAGARPRKCKHCRESFLPERGGQIVHESCAPAYGQKLYEKRLAKQKADRAKAAKVERVADKARLATFDRLPKLIAAAQKEFNAYIRERDKDQPCICCGRTSHDRDLLTGSRWDAGHYRSTGSASHLRFREDNCHRQLVHCNRHGAGRAVDYRIGLVARIGQVAVDALEADNTPRKWTREELREIAATYRAKAKALKAQKEETA